MKKMIVLLIAFITFVSFSGCREKNPSQNEKEKIGYISILTIENISYTIGDVEKIENYYNNEDALLFEKVYGNNDRIFLTEYQYDGIEVESTILEMAYNGKITGRIVIYSAGDLILDETHYDENNDEICSYHKEYDDNGNLIIDRGSSPDNTINYYEKYIYDESGLVVEIQSLNNDGTIRRRMDVSGNNYIVLLEQKDDEGRLIKEVKSRNGDEFTTTYEYYHEDEFDCVKKTIYCNGILNISNITKTYEELSNAGLKTKSIVRVENLTEHYTTDQIIEYNVDGKCETIIQKTNEATDSIFHYEYQDIYR